jgi:hypothetical protein
MSGHDSEITALAHALQEEIARGGALALSQLEESHRQAGRAGVRLHILRGGGLVHLADPQPVPARVSEAQSLKATAARTLEAIALATGSGQQNVALSGLPPPQPDHLCRKGCAGRCPSRGCRTRRCETGLLLKDTTSGTGAPATCHHLHRQRPRSQTVRMAGPVGVPGPADPITPAWPPPGSWTASAPRLPGASMRSPGRA